MSEFLEKIKYFVQSASREQAIKGLINLQIEAPQNIKFKCRLACLHLMQMNHDWEGIRKLLIQWNLIKSFGKQLVIRMRKRVGQDPGSIIDDSDTIKKQLDRLNEKNWRQFSPKKKFPDYLQFLKQSIKNQNSNTISRNAQQNLKQIKVEHEKQEKIEREVRQSNLQCNSIFSKLAQFQKNDKKEKQVNTRGVFSKQFFKGQVAQTNQQKKKLQKPILIDKQKEKKLPFDKKPILQQSKRIEKPSYVNQSQKISQIQPKPLTPSKQLPKKIISLKYGNQKQKPKQQFKDEFSFSAVKAKQQIQGISQKSSKADQLDNSFLNFSNQSKIIKDKNDIVSEKKNNILQQINREQQPFVLSQSRYNQVKPLFTQQQLSLVQPNIPHKNYIKSILKAEGIGAAEMLRKQLLL